MDRRALEERLTVVELELSDLRMELKNDMAKLEAQKAKLKKMEELHAVVTKAYRNLKAEARIVSLSEFKKVRDSAHRGAKAIPKLRQEVRTLEAKNEHIAKQVTLLSEEEAELKEQLARFGKVLAFRSTK